MTNFATFCHFIRNTKPSVMSKSRDFSFFKQKPTFKHLDWFDIEPFHNEFIFRIIKSDTLQKKHTDGKALHLFFASITKFTQFEYEAIISFFLV